ncbi:MAG: hypothetical protein PHH00_00085 [Candidatus Nanoarchaeia archaeon]|nr:hypothetical protein [Candidatus Nanoarchaeia archaeon]
MKVLGFNFNKISIERFPKKAEGLKINTDISILGIDSVNTDLFKTKEEFLGVRFSYKINYDPDYAKVEFLGDIIVALDSKDAKEVLKEWKDKKFPEDFKIFVFNVILKKSNLKALELEDEMNLPLHLPLPSLKKASDKQ